jgi:hypothetical protein
MTSQLGSSLSTPNLNIAREIQVVSGIYNFRDKLLFVTQFWPLFNAIIIFVN